MPTTSTCSPVSVRMAVVTVRVATRTKRCASTPFARQASATGATTGRHGLSSRAKRSSQTVSCRAHECLTAGTSAIFHARGIMRAWRIAPGYVRVTDWTRWSTSSRRRQCASPPAWGQSQ